MTARKAVEFRGSSLDDLRAFPEPARREAGHQVINLTKCSKARSLTTGSQCQGLVPGFRKFGCETPLGRSVVYVAKFASAVYVLHCFRKKTQKTSKTDLDLAEKCYRDLTKELDR